jgi:RNA polymerase sigma-70 factor (ECF subfamily)
MNRGNDPPRWQHGGMVGVAAEEERLWVLKAQKGDQSAFTRLVEAYQAPVYNLAYRLLGNPAEAEDAAQEVFIRAYTKLDTCDPERRFSSWILSIAAHYCVDRLRRRKGDWVSIEEGATAFSLPDRRPKPEELALRREQSAIIQDLLQRLPPQYRLVVVLRYWYDCSYEEIAAMTQSTESAVKSRLHRARQMIAAMLAQIEAGKGIQEANERRMKEHAVSRSF